MNKKQLIVTWIIAVFIQLSFSAPCLVYAEWFDSGWLVNYRGEFGDKKGGLTLVFDGDTIKGEIYYDSDYRDIPVSGRISNGKNIRLEGNEGILISGKFVDEDTEYGNHPLDKEALKGTITYEGKELPFRISLDNAVSGSLDNMYSTAGFDDDKAVEDFAQQFKGAVIRRDKAKVASMINYHVELKVNGKSINNEKDFIANYDLIIDENAYKEIANSPTHKMFCNYKGVMLGNGVVWFGGGGKEVVVIDVGNARIGNEEIIRSNAPY